MVRHPYPVAIKLCAIAAERWNELIAAYYQINLVKQSPARFVGLVYAWCVERVPHDKIEEWERDLQEPLPWQDSESESSIQAESDSFMAMMAKQG